MKKRSVTGLAGLTLVALLLVLAACARAPSTSTFDSSQGGKVAPMSTPAPATGAGPAVFPPLTVTSSAGPKPTPYPMPTSSPTALYGNEVPADTDRMIVRTGDMAVVVQDINATIDRITTLVENSRGYVVSSRSWRDGDRLHGNISIRVPAGDYDSILKSISDLAVEVTSSTTSSQDVTQEYVDLTARLKNLEATERQLLSIMEKAVKVEDILSVQRELTNTRSQIEQLKARTQYLERTSAMSLINVNLEQSTLGVKFNADKRFAKVGESIKFSPNVSGGFAPYSYEWDFGDGETGNSSDPTHSYKATGTYTVSLKVTDDRGNTDTETTKDYITITPGWSAGNTLNTAWRGMVAFSHGLVNVLIWLGIFSPVWLIGGGIVYWIRRRRQKAKAS